MNRTKRIDRPNRKVCRTCGRWTQLETDKNVGTCDFDDGISHREFSCVAWKKGTEREAKQ